MFNFSNSLTAARLLLVIPVVLTYLIPFPYHGLVAAGLFAIASFIDWADGYVARKRNEESSLGAAFDHISDKILVSAVLIAISYQMHSMTITICTMLIISREIFISGLREHMAYIGKRAMVTVTWFGKIKTAMQMAVIFIILISQPLSLPAFPGEVLIIVVTLITIISAWSYLPIAKTYNPTYKNTE